MARENVHPVPVLMVTLNLTRAFRVSAALRDTFGQTVIGYRSVADVVLQYAAVLERKAAEHALPQFFRGSEYDPDVLDHAVRPETVNIFHAIALEGEAKSTQARYLHRVSLLELLGHEASISMGAVVVLAVAAHVIALPESGVSLLGVAYHLPGSCLFCGFTFLINLYFAILFCFKLLIM